MGFLPLLGRELKGQMRGRRAPLVAALYLGLMVIVLGGSLLIGEAAARGGGEQLSGPVLFVALALTQSSLILLLGPIFSAGAIAGERERRTFDTLLATPITSSGIVLGKLWAAVAFQALLVTSSLPLMAVAYLYGGVGPGTLLAVYAWDLLLIVWAASFTIACSALVGRTLWAAVLAYVVLFLAIAVTPFLEGVRVALLTAGWDGADAVPGFTPLFLYANPFSGLAELLFPSLSRQALEQAGWTSFVAVGLAWHLGVAVVSLAIATWATSPVGRLHRRG